MDALETKVKELIGEWSGFDSADLKDADTLVEDLGMDSLELANLAIELEEAFDVEVADDRIRANMTVSEVVTAVRDLAA